MLELPNALNASRSPKKGVHWCVRANNCSDLVAEIYPVGSLKLRFVEQFDQYHFWIGVRKQWRQVVPGGRDFRNACITHVQIEQGDEAEFAQRTEHVPDLRQGIVIDVPQIDWKTHGLEPP